MSNKLPDGGAQLRAQKQAILNRMAVIKRPIPEIDLTNTATSAPAVSGPTAVAEVSPFNCINCSKIRQYKYYVLHNACVYLCTIFVFACTVPHTYAVPQHHHTFLCTYLQPLVSSSPSLPHSTTTKRVS